MLFGSYKLPGNIAPLGGEKMYGSPLFLKDAMVFILPGVLTIYCRYPTNKREIKSLAGEYKRNVMF